MAGKGKRVQELETIKAPVSRDFSPPVFSSKDICSPAYYVKFGTKIENNT
jgi:hypothetical protein